MRLMYLSFAALLLAFASCYAFVPYVRKLENSGPDSVNDWANKYDKSQGRYPSNAEKAAIESQLKDKVARYIAANPGLTDLKKSQLRTLYVQLGMTKSEVRLFLNRPVAVNRDLKVMAEQADTLWPELQPGIDESWEYEPYTYYFAGETLVNIIHRMPAIQPL